MGAGRVEGGRNSSQMIVGAVRTGAINGKCEPRPVYERDELLPPNSLHPIPPLMLLINSV